MYDKFVRRIIYSLKKKFRQPLSIYKYISETNNLTTGRIEYDYQIIYVRDAIVLPVKQYRALIPLIKPLTWYDATTKLIIVEQALTLQDHFEFNGHKYKIVEIHDNYMYLVQETVGIFAIGRSINADDKLNMMETITYESNGIPELNISISDNFAITEATNEQ